MELTSPRKGKSSKHNVAEGSFNTATYTLSTASDDSDIRNIFSVNRSSDKQKNVAAVSEGRTISEISDNIFLVKHEINKTTTKDSQKPYRQKIAEHLKKIRQNVRSPSHESHLKKGFKIPVEKIRRESHNVNMEVEMVRSKFSLKNKAALQQEKENFLSFSWNKNNKVYFLHTKYSNILKYIVSIENKLIITKIFCYEEEEYFYTLLLSFKKWLRKF